MKKISKSEWNNIFTENSPKDAKNEKDIFLKAIDQLDSKKTIHKKSIETGIKKSTLNKKLKKTFDVSIDSTIDLHLRTKKETSFILKSFIEDSINKRDKFVLIIHGKGIHSTGSGILKSFVKQILESKFNNVIDWYSIAPKKYGGDGAVIVKLKSEREDE